MRKIIFAVVYALLASYSYAGTELVMHEGVIIEAREENTLVKVTSDKGFARTYEWDQFKLKSESQ